MKKLFLLFIGVILMTSCQQAEKSAFVDTEKIFKEYKGVKAQEAIFKQKQEAFTKKYDTLVKLWQKEVMNFQQNVSKMSPKKAKQKDRELYQKQQQIQQLQQQEGAALSAEMQQQTDSIIKGVYDFLKTYGNKNGYDYIHGKNNTGALMYAAEKHDITNEVLKALDADYESNQTSQEKTPEEKNKS